jgi:hypothetical protein
MKSIITIALFFVVTATAQTEILTNAKIIEMVKAGIGGPLVINKIKSADGNFDVSADGMIELKKAGVTDEIIAVMMEKPTTVAPAAANSKDTPIKPGEPAATVTKPAPPAAKSPKEILAAAKTIAFMKSSLNPSRQALEKELLKRKDWQDLNLTIDRYKESADLYVEIGFVSLSLVTHRYVYRIYDRRSGTVIAAGETTSWGSLAENLARNISASVHKIAAGK